MVKARVDKQAQLMAGSFPRRRRPDNEVGEPLEPEPGTTRAAPFRHTSGGRIPATWRIPHTPVIRPQVTDVTT